MLASLFYTYILHILAYLVRPMLFSQRFPVAFALRSTLDTAPFFKLSKRVLQQQNGPHATAVHEETMETRSQASRWI